MTVLFLESPYNGQLSYFGYNTATEPEPEPETQVRFSNSPFLFLTFTEIF